MEWIIGIIGLVILAMIGVRLEKISGQLSEVRDLLAAIYDNTRH